MLTNKTRVSPFAVNEQTRPRDDYVNRLAQSSRIPGGKIFDAIRPYYGRTGRAVNTPRYMSSPIVDIKLTYQGRYPVFQTLLNKPRLPAWLRARS